MNLTEKAMTARVSISQWTARKYDAKITKEVADSHGTTQDAGRYNKVLIARDALQKIEQATSAARGAHLRNTLPWMDDGSRILPAANYFAYTEEMRELRYTFDREVAMFIRNYEAFVEEARIRLNGMFNASDYPHAAEIRRRFGFDIVILPLPNAADFRVSIGSAEEDRIRADIQARADEAIGNAVKDTWNRVQCAVGHMADKLGRYDPNGKGKERGTFRDTLVDNVRELADLLPRLNITGDAAMDAIAKEMHRKLCWADADTLRESDATRVVVAADAKDILSKMSGYCGDLESTDEE